jgi:predicted ribosomally synthesized peptide with nif11-like leader
MANDHLTRFFDLVREDQSLQEQLSRVTDTEQFSQLAVELGAARGLAFAAADVKAVAEADLAARRAELSDAELASVAGGGTLSYGCAGVVMTYACTDPRSCFAGGGLTPYTGGCLTAAPTSSPKVCLV